MSTVVGLTDITGEWATVTTLFGPRTVTVSELEANAWKTFSLDTPLEWDGVASVVVELSVDALSSADGGGIFFRDVEGLSGRSVFGFSDSDHGNYPFATLQARDTSGVMAIRLGSAERHTSEQHFMYNANRAVDGDTVSKSSAWVASYTVNTLHQPFQYTVPVSQTNVTENEQDFIETI